MNWGDLRTEIRVELDDTSETPKFTDDMLWIYLREAVADYSQYLPLVQDSVTLDQELDNSRKFALPADFLEVITVACPVDRYLEPARGRLGTRAVAGNRPLFYRIDPAYLYLDVDPGTNEVIITYKASHPVPTAANDITFVFTIPAVNLELIKLYVEGKVNGKIRNAQARLDRFKIGAGARTDNPMKEETEDFFEAYYKKLEQRVPAQSLTLYRPRKYK